KYGQQSMKEVGMTKQLHLQSAGLIHTTAGYTNEITKTVNPSFLVVLLLIAALIQVIACINFMNLSTARASRRAKEVGVRKVIGAGRKDLVGQFLGESLLLSLAGVLVALPLLALAMPYLNQITQTDVQLSLFADYRLWAMLAGLVMVTGLVAGSYPAFYLSAFQAIKVIKGNFINHISVADLRRSLVVFQFVLSIVLITGIIVIYSQLNYLKSKDLGFEKDQKLIFSFQSNEALSKLPAFMNDLRELAEVKAVSNADNYPGQFAVLRNRYLYLAGGNAATAPSAETMRTDAYYAKTLGIQLVSGRDFRLQDSSKVLVNETLCTKLGLDPATAAGRRLYAGDEEMYEIAGVIKDFNYNSLREKVKPLVLMHEPDGSRLPNLIVATNSRNYQAMLEKVETLWQKNFPGLPFEYAFLDSEVQAQYETEITLSRIINSFTLVAILISSLGLFGLAAFSVEQRTKEMGVRKVLGASVFHLTTLLSKDFLGLVVVAVVIATPVSWWATNQWLQNFAYKTAISWWMFAVAGLIAIFIALLTISFQTIKAAMANPVKSLRTE
ncbi:MAG: FtsX-like permease family protein, partial [Ferruginibacter sp.]|nr:FtsX-like permease family protein [Cytophagales bacterium]